MNFDDREIFRISDICRIRRGASPRPIQEYMSERGMPWVKISDVTSTESRYVKNTKEFIKEEGVAKSRLVEEGTLILSNSATPGIPKIMKIQACVHDGWLILDDFKSCTKDYMYYLLLNERERLVNLSNGSVFRNLKTDIVKNYLVSLPSVLKQEKITNILTTLDEKIEVNNRINRILENMAQEIFKRWFVDFEFPNEDGEPYKSSDGEMVESELGLIPRGWSVGTLSELVDSTLGGDWGKEIAQENYDRAVYCIRGADIEPIKQGEQGKAPKRYILEKNLVKKRLEPGNLIIEISGGSPTQSTGRVLYVSEQVISRFEEPIICTNFCRAIKLKKREYMEFVYYYWDLLYRENVFFNYENGTTGIKNLDINSFLNRHQIIIPSENTIFEFTKIMQLLQKNIQSNGTQNRRIGDIRDLLLPKLMSGEIRVPLEEAKY